MLNAAFNVVYFNVGDLEPETKHFGAEIADCLWEIIFLSPFGGIDNFN